MANSKFRAISLSFKSAPVEIRELIALDETIVSTILSEAKEIAPIDELLILSTCNRTELYYSAPNDCDDELIAFIGMKKGILEMNSYKPYFEFFDSNHLAVEHLFRVSMGLEAQVIGDMQISNQIKRAYQLTAHAGLAGPFLHRLLHTIFFSSKRVAQETSFRDGAASVSYVASELIQNLAQSIIEPKVLVLGLGEIGEDVCRHLAETDLSVSVSNRTLAKAESIATECNLQHLSFEKVDEEIEQFDIVISSIASEKAFITREKILRQSIQGYKYFLDLSVPRSIENSITDIPGVSLYNIDDIQSKASATLEKRKAAIPHVESIIADSMSEFGNWEKEMIVSPTINKLKKALEEIRQQELAKHLKNATEDQKAFAQKISQGITQKIMKLPVLQLKAACQRGDEENLIDVLNDLFNLEKEKEKK